jgi:hypothetical protein
MRSIGNAMLHEVDGLVQPIPVDEFLHRIKSDSARDQPFQVLNDYAFSGQDQPFQVLNDDAFSGHRSINLQMHICSIERNQFASHTSPMPTFSSSWGPYMPLSKSSLDMTSAQLPNEDLRFSRCGTSTLLKLSISFLSVRGLRICPSMGFGCGFTH